MTKANPCENDVKTEIKKLLDEFGWHHWPASAGGYTTGGVADRLALRGRPGYGCIFLAIEAKLDAPNGTKLQETFLQNCRDQGAIGVVVNQTRLPKLRQLLEAIDLGLFPMNATTSDPAPVDRSFGDFGWSTTESGHLGRRGGR